MCHALNLSGRTRCNLPRKRDGERSGRNPHRESNNPEQPGVNILNGLRSGGPGHCPDRKLSKTTVTRGLVSTAPFRTLAPLLLS